MTNNPQNQLTKCMQFINEIDKLKKIIRVNLLSDGSRRENSAEHSWHFAVMTWVLSKYSQSANLDLMKVIKMALIHDLVEIDAGDVYALQPELHLTKDSDERVAAERIFGLLPDDLNQELWDIWREFELGKTAEAKYARAIDRLNPFLQNYLSNGRTWIENDINVDQIHHRMSEVRVNTPELWPFVEQLIDQSVANGWVKDSIKS